MPFLQRSVDVFSFFQTLHPLLSSLAFIAVPCLVIYTVTYAVTWIQFQLGSMRDRGQRKTALVIPYGIPFLGSAISMATDLQNTLERLAALPQASRPLAVKAGPQRIFLIFGPDNLRQVFNAKETTQKERVLDIFSNLGMSQKDLDIIHADHSGDQAKPKCDINQDQRIFRNSAENFTGGLMAPESTRLMAERYVQELTERFRAFDGKAPFTTPLFKFLKKEMVYASGIALHGQVLFEQNPDFHEALWGFDDAFPNLLLRLPRWLVPRTYAKTDRLRDQVRKWYQVAMAHNDPREPQEAHWDRYWGSRFWRNFVHNFLRAGIDLDSAAPGSISTIWATHGNAIPGSTWVLMEILTRPQLMADIVEELKKATTSTAPPSFDRSVLLESPLLNAVWDETLRLRVATVVYREAQEDLYISDTLIPKGSQMICANVPQQSPKLWQPFKDVSSSPEQYQSLPFADTGFGPRDFDPVRFLAAKQVKADKTASKEERSRATAALSPYNYFPWGGGSHICPGRYFAKQEVFYTVAMLLTAFDIEVLGWETFQGKQMAEPAQPNSVKYGFGMLAPDRDLGLRIKKREMW